MANLFHNHHASFAVSPPPKSPGALKRLSAWFGVADEQSFNQWNMMRTVNLDDEAASGADGQDAEKGPEGLPSILSITKGAIESGAETLRRKLRHRGGAAEKDKDRAANQPPAAGANKQPARAKGYRDSWFSLEWDTDGATKLSAPRSQGSGAGGNGNGAPDKARPPRPSTSAPGDGPTVVASLTDLLSAVSAAAAPAAPPPVAQETKLPSSAAQPLPQSRAITASAPAAPAAVPTAATAAAAAPAAAAAAADKAPPRRATAAAPAAMAAPTAAPAPAPAPVGGEKTAATAAVSERATRSALPPPKRSAPPEPKPASQKTMVNNQLLQLTENRPFFVYYMMLCQIVVLAVSMGVYGVAPIAFAPSTEQQLLNSEDGTTSQYTRIVRNNFWIGPSLETLVTMGAKYAPCMRIDDRITTEVLDPQAKTFAIPDNVSAVSNPIGCCSNGITSSAHCFTTVKNNCTLGHFEAGMYCGGPQCCKDYDAGTKISGTYPDCDRANSSETSLASCKCEITGRPCCVGLLGRCEIRSAEYCDFVGGKYFDSKVSCSEVNCLEAQCALIKFANGKPDQFFRFYLPLFQSTGVVHLLLILIFEYAMAINIEKLAGWLRMIFLFTISGVGGYMTSALLMPYTPSVGASPALYGLMASLFVELFQSWQLLDNPCIELFKLLVVAIVALAIGLLPYIDNFAHVGGFIFGLLSAIIFLPYITFGKWDMRAKRLMLVICIPLTALLMAIILSLFYSNKIHSCSWCPKFECIDFISNFCQDNDGNQLS